MPYDFIRKRISILVENNHSRFLITKGAFQSVIDICTHVETESGEVIDIHQVYHDMQKRFAGFSNEGYRVLGIAYCKGEEISSLAPEHEKQMIFLGFLLFWRSN